MPQHEAMIALMITWCNCIAAANAHILDEVSTP
jgi:hypothetical protein